MSNVAPTDSRTLSQSQNGNIPTGNGSCAHNSQGSMGSNDAMKSWENSTSLYFPCFSTIVLEAADLDVLKGVIKQMITKYFYQL